MAEAIAKFDDRGIFRSGLVKTGFVAFLILYFLYLVFANTPASLAAWAVHKAVPSVWLTSVEGTLWNGVARGAQVDLGKEALPLGPVSWKLNPVSILFFTPCVTFQSDMVSGKLCQSITGSSTVEDLSVEAPIAVVRDLLPVEASGQFSLQVIEADFTMKAVKKLNAKLSLQNARVNPVDQWVGLGSIAAQTNEDGQGGISAKVFDIQGPLGLDMQATWKPGAESFKIGGTVTIKDGASNVYQQGLKMFGEEIEENKVYKVQWP